MEPDDAFAVFTQETDLWWRRGLKYRLAGRRPGVLCFEPGVGGRLFESFETESGTQVYQTGRITVWEPPRRLVVKWRTPNFASNESTELEVLFEPSGRVRVSPSIIAVGRHFRSDHPARHGLEGAAFSRMMGLWWSDQMTSLRELIEAKTE